MNGISIGDWNFAITDIAIIVLCLGIVSLALHVMHKRVRPIVDSFLFDGSAGDSAMKASVLLATNFPLYLLRTLSQHQANSHIEPTGGQIAVLCFVPLIAGVVIKAISNTPTISRKPGAMLLCFHIVALLGYWTYQYLSIRCQPC